MNISKVEATSTANVQQTTPSFSNNATSAKGHEDVAKSTVDSSNSPSNHNSQNVIPSSPPVLSVEARVGQSEDTELPLHADAFKVKLISKLQVCNMMIPSIII